MNGKLKILGAGIAEDFPAAAQYIVLAGVHTGVGAVEPDELTQTGLSVEGKRVAAGIVIIFKLNNVQNCALNNTQSAVVPGL